MPFSFVLLSLTISIPREMTLSRSAAKFSEACAQGRIDDVKGFLSKGRLSPEDISCGLNAAIYEGQKDIISLLRASTGVDVNVPARDIDGFVWFPFEQACASGDMETARALLEDGADFSAQAADAFRSSCQRGQTSSAKWLLEKGFKVDTFTSSKSFGIACQKGHLGTAQWLSSLESTNIHVDDDRPFKAACTTGKLKVVKWLTEDMGCDSIAIVTVGLLVACYHGQVKVAEYLVSKGADIMCDDIPKCLADAKKKGLGSACADFIAEKRKPILEERAKAAAAVEAAGDKERQDKMAADAKRRADKAARVAAERAANGGAGQKWSPEPKSDKPKKQVGTWVWEECDYDYDRIWDPLPPYAGYAPKEGKSQAQIARERVAEKQALKAAASGGASADPAPRAETQEREVGGKSKRAASSGGGKKAKFSDE